MDAELRAFATQMDAMPASQVRQDLILMVAMNSMLDPEDASYLVDEMITGDMSDADLGPRAHVMIARCARG